MVGGKPDQPPAQSPQLHGSRDVDRQQQPHQELRREHCVPFQPKDVDPVRTTGTGCQRRSVVRGVPVGCFPNKAELHTRVCSNVDNCGSGARDQPPENGPVGRNPGFPHPFRGSPRQAGREPACLSHQTDRFCMAPISPSGYLPGAGTGWTSPRACPAGGQAGTPANPDVAIGTVTRSARPAPRAPPGPPPAALAPPGRRPPPLFPHPPPWWYSFQKAGRPAARPVWRVDRTGDGDCLQGDC